MTWRRIGSFGSSGSIRLMKYGVMSTRNLSGAERPVALLVGQVQDLLDLVEVVDPVESCQRQSFHFSSGTSAQSGARRLTAGRPSGPSGARRVAQVDERRLGGGAGGLLVGDRGLDLVGVHAGSASWSASAPGRRPAPTHKVYAVCKSRR